LSLGSSSTPASTNVTEKKSKKKKKKKKKKKVQKANGAANTEIEKEEMDDGGETSEPQVNKVH
jgi:hypothetical protein